MPEVAPLHGVTFASAAAERAAAGMSAEDFALLRPSGKGRKFTAGDVRTARAERAGADGGG